MHRPGATSADGIRPSPGGCPQRAGPSPTRACRRSSPTGTGAISHCGEPDRVPFPIPIPYTPPRPQSLPQHFDERRRHRRRAGRAGRTSLQPSYLPNGRKQGRYWCAGDVHGAAGRSLFVRLAPPGAVGKFSDSATGQYGDLLDLIRLATGARSLREALAEAHRFLGQAPAPAAESPATYDRTAAARNLWNRCGPIEGTHTVKPIFTAREHRPLPFPGIEVSPRAPPPLRSPDSGAGSRRWSPPSPATTANCTESTVPGSIPTVP